MRISLQHLADDKFGLKNKSIRDLRQEMTTKNEQGQSDVQEFENVCMSGAFAKEEGSEDAEREELTVMDGFRYRINDTCFPVYKGKEKLTEFPIIPIGMLDIWRSENEE